MTHNPNQMYLVRWTIDGKQDSMRVRGGNPRGHKAVIVKCGGKNVTVKKVNG